MGLSVKKVLRIAVCAAIALTIYLNKRPKSYVAASPSKGRGYI